MKKLKLISLGFITGVLNGLLGAGGGMIVVPLLKKLGVSVKSAHATSVLVILPLTLASACLYLFQGRMTLNDAWIYMPFGAVGAVIGAKLLPKISNKAISRIFALFILYAAVRLFFR